MRDLSPGTLSLLVRFPVFQNTLLRFLLVFRYLVMPEPLVRDRIVSGGAKRIAPEDAVNGQDKTCKKASFLKRLNGVG